MSTGMLIFLYVIPLAVLWSALVIDLVTRDDIGLGKKLAWGALTFLTAEFGAAVYIAMRPLRYPEDGARPGEGNLLAEEMLTAVGTDDPKRIEAAKERVLGSVR